MGYDGIIDNTYHQVIVFEPEQTKIINNKNPYMSAYKEYMKEHPNSKMTFENFKKNLE